MIQNSLKILLDHFYSMNETELEKQVLEEMPLDISFFYYGWSRGVIRDPYELYHQSDVLLTDIEPLLWLKHNLVKEDLINSDLDLFWAMSVVNEIIKAQLTTHQQCCQLISKLKLTKLSELTVFSYLINAFADYMDPESMPLFLPEVYETLDQLSLISKKHRSLQDLYQEYSSIKVVGHYGLADWVFLVRRFALSRTCQS